MSEDAGRPPMDGERPEGEPPVDGQAPIAG